MAAVFCLTVAAHAFAEESLPKKVPFTAKGFVDFYRSNKEEHDKAKVFVHGIIDGLWGADALLKRDTGREQFCWPPQFAIVEDQLVRMVDQYLQKNPSASDEMFSTVAAVALAAAFPCNKQ
jgi:hypothetical protein